MLVVGEMDEVGLFMFVVHVVGEMDEVGLFMFVVHVGEMDKVGQFMFVVQYLTVSELFLLLYLS